MDLKNLQLKIVLLSSCVFFALSATAEKRHHHAHSHGVGHFSLVQEGKAVEVELKVPAHDIVGFEHMPKNDGQKGKVQKAKSQFERASSVVTLPSAAGCQREKVEVESALLEEKSDHHDHGHDHHHDKKEDGHSEFHVTLKFRCDQPTELKQVEVVVFRSFSGMKSLKAQAVTSSGQYSQKLTGSKTTFKLN